MYSWWVSSRRSGCCSDHIDASRAEGCSSFRPVILRNASKGRMAYNACIVLYSDPCHYPQTIVLCSTYSSKANIPVYCVQGFLSRVGNPSISASRKKKHAEDWKSLSCTKRSLDRTTFNPYQWSLDSCRSILSTDISNREKWQMFARNDGQSLSTSFFSMASPCY